MPNLQQYRKDTGSTVFDPAVVGLATLLISVSAFCIFLLCLKRGTPHLRPYATTVVASNRFNIQPFTDINQEPTSQYYDGPEWVLNFGSTPILFNTNFDNETFVTEQISDNGAKKTEFSLTCPMPGSVYMQCSYIALNDNQYLWLGGTRDRHDTSPNLTPPSVLTQRNTWYGTNPRNILSSHTLVEGPPMCVSRARPKLLREPNQNILISGGVAQYKPSIINDEAIATDSLEEYNSKQKKIFTLGKMQIPRHEHGICQLADGNILIVSGRTNAKLSDSEDDLTSTLEVFSPKTKSSVIVGQLHRAMTNPLLIPLKNGKIFILDSKTLTGRIDMHPYAELYENAQGQVQKLPHLPSIAELVHTIMHWQEPTIPK